jgi:hypothetical protein
VNLKINDAVMLNVREYGSAQKQVIRRVEYLSEDGGSAYVHKDESKPWEGYFELTEGYKKTPTMLDKDEWKRIGVFTKVETGWLKKTTKWVMADSEPVQPEPKPQRSGDTPEHLMAAAAVLLFIMWLPGHLDTITYWLRLTFCGGGR